MRLSYRMAMHLFEAAETIGVSREQLVEPLGLDAKSLVDPAVGIEWDTLVAALEQLSLAVGGDAERLRDVGRAMVTAPSFAALQRLARAVVSLRSVYLAGERWIAPTNAPHVVIRTTFPSEDRARVLCRVPEPYSASAPYLLIFEGLLERVPTVMGLEPAIIESSSVTDRELDTVLVLPRSRSVLERAKHLARAAIHRADALQVFEGRRREFAETLEEARRSTEEIVTVFARVPDVVIIHREGTILWLNGAAARTFGYADTAPLVGRALIELFHPSSHALVRERIHGASSDAAAPDLVEANLVRRDGSRLQVEVAPSQAVTFGRKEARLFVARDVTERKRLQQQLAIADRLASIGMLAAGVAHEVNNPLAYVLNNIEIARRELAPLGDAVEASRASLEVALEGVDRIRTIVRDLLALARVDDDALGVVDPCAVVQSTLALATPQIHERAELVQELVPTPAVVGTASRLGQVLLNLIANALEAMPAQDRASNVLSVAVRPGPGGGAVIEVADNGVGIAAEHASRIFEPFFTTKPDGRGTGLGLAISERIVAELGGVLSFEPAVPRGTVFRMTLPPPA